MAKRVSADTITQITGAAAFREDQKPASAPPTTEELIEKTRTRLQKETIAAKAWLDAADPENERTIEQRTKDVVQAEANEKLFEELLKDVPKGFKLAPTFYSRITMEENDAIKQEYSYHVRPRFLKFVGENYAGDLRKLGIAEEGIERMKNGLDPEDADGKKYNLNVDHIIERAGSGTMGKTKSPDPDSPHCRETFDINHFGNFILLPEPVHEFKNKLNDLQVASDMPYGKGKWILMMVPERTAKNHGFVAQPQPANSKLEGVTAHYPGINHSRYILDVITAEIAEMKETGNIRNIVRGLVSEAGDQKVAEAADLDARKKKGGLRQKFNDAIAKDKDSEFIVNGLVRPAIKDVTDTLTKLFRHVSYDTAGRREQDFWDFARLFRSQQVKDLRVDIEALPVPEAAEMHRAFNLLEKDVNALADKLDAAGKARRAANPNPRPKPVNDNGAKKPFNKKPFRKNNNGGGRIKQPGAR